MFLLKNLLNPIVYKSMKCCRWVVFSSLSVVISVCFNIVLRLLTGYKKNHSCENYSIKSEKNYYCYIGLSSYNVLD